MPEEEVNFDGIDKPQEQDEPPTNIPPGWYYATILSYEKRKSHGSGKKYLMWELKIEDQHPKFRVWYVTMLEGPGTWAIQRFLWAFDRVKPTGKHKFDPKNYLERRFRVKLGTSQYEGNYHNRVVDVRSEDGLFPDAPSYD